MIMLEIIIHSLAYKNKTFNANFPDVEPQTFFHVSLSYAMLAKFNESSNLVL